MNSARSRLRDAIRSRQLTLARATTIGKTRRRPVRCTGCKVRLPYPRVDTAMLTREDVPQMPLLSTHPAGSFVDIGLKDLPSFLPQHETSNPKPRMISPWSGIPLPSIHISSGASSVFSGKLELSIPLMHYLKSVGANVDNIAS